MPMADRKYITVLQNSDKALACSTLIIQMTSQFLELTNLAARAKNSACWGGRLLFVTAAVARVLSSISHPACLAQTVVVLPAMI
ncbi:hypothetical protein MTHERMOG20_25940 [Moorella thermoacetica]|nr:hypothetical protein MTHERMOG20_25940 [Moorella thermoacetica]